MFTFEDALIIAAGAHRGQLYGNEPYIMHPLRVAARVPTQDAKLAAILHDVIEDSPLTLGQLVAEGVPYPIAAAVHALSRDKDTETYAQYIDRIVNHPGREGRLARIVKRADLEENLSQQFGGGNLRQRYLRALSRLSDVDFGEEGD